ncbi:MAG: ribonuclease P protein subunit [Candidatus Nanoarchaeia archaeon]|nr:ribonuclease P protein subunit [Candidatus Nanoarchaeia archaeon]
MLNEKNLQSHELIGLSAKVKKIKGLIVDESKNTITIWDKKKEIIIPKKNNEFEINVEKKIIIINGESIAQRPYDRLKKKNKVKNKW